MTPTAEQLRLARECAAKTYTDPFAQEDIINGEWDHDYDVRAALLAIQATEARMAAAVEWQDIATAPKDGTCVLLYKPDERMVGEYTLAGYWGEWPGYPEGWIAADGKPQGYFSEAANAPQGYPTHWLPLPAPPKAALEQEQAEDLP